jgi:putative ABC transport system permease protein
MGQNIKLVIRTLLRHKVVAGINVIGLAIGMTACILIMMYVSYEHSYDTFHKDLDQLYRVQFNIYRDGEQTVACAAAVPAVGPAFVDNFPEAEAYCRAFPISGVVNYKEQSVRHEKVQVVTPSFLEILNFPLITGDIHTVLSRPNTAVITHSEAKKLFGDADPVGETIVLNGSTELEITGVCKDVPQNSHLKFTLLVSYGTLHEWAGDSVETSWGWYDFNTYLRVRKGTDARELEDRFNQWLHKERSVDFANRGRNLEFLLQPVRSIHLWSDLLQESQPDENGDGDAVQFLTIIALFILLIAWINYINVTTARSMERAREVGIRKVSGADRWSLMRQFFVESIGTNIVSVVASVLLVWALLPYFRHLTGIPLGFELLFSGVYGFALIGFFVIGSFLSGLYPALVLSSFSPVTVFKGKLNRQTTGINLRTILVVVQYVISIGLIAGTIIVMQQLHYLRSQDTGFTTDQVLVIRGPESSESDSLVAVAAEAFKETILKNPSIVSMSTTSNVPGDEIFWATGSGPKNATRKDMQVMYIVGMDEHYLETFDIALVTGRNFKREYASEDSATIINEAAVSWYGFDSAEDALGKEVELSTRTLHIVGVIDNYNQMSLKQAVQPLIFPYYSHLRGFYCFKLQGGAIPQTIREIKELYQQYFPGNPFDYFFMDEFFDQQYRKDLQFGKIFTLFSGLAIFIACLGLFALVSYSALQRTREIGIRKVLGASVGSIVSLLLKDFFSLILLANAVAVPVAWFIMQRWLRNFAYRIEINVMVFVVSAFLITIISLCTVGMLTIKTAHADPAKALKHE